MKRMKRISCLLFVLVMALDFSVRAHATLYLRGQGISVHGTYNLIYDDDLDITWYDYTTMWGDDWAGQVSWADALTVDFGGRIYDDWRLPVTDATCSGFNCSGSELGHLYYTELGNLPGEPISETGPFQRLTLPFYYPEGATYWTGTEYSLDPAGSAWLFHFGGAYTFSWEYLGGYQQVELKTGYGAAGIAVRDGDVAATAPVPVPEPSTLLLLGSGLAWLAGLVRRLGSRPA